MTAPSCANTLIIPSFWKIDGAAPGRCSALQVAEKQLGEMSIPSTISIITVGCLRWVTAISPSTASSRRKTISK